MKAGIVAMLIGAAMSWFMDLNRPVHKCYTQPREYCSWADPTDCWYERDFYFSREGCPIQSIK